MIEAAVIGCGQMGRAAAYALASRSDVGSIVLVDRDGTVAQRLARWLGDKTRATLTGRQADAGDTATLSRLLGPASVIAAALPWDATVAAAGVALQLGRPMASIARPESPALEELHARARARRVPLAVGCGLEPGLTEVLALAALRRMPDADELHVRCGGVPSRPRPPLDYSLSFGTRLSIAPRDAYVIEDGHVHTVARFSGVDRTYVDGVGELEAFHDGMLAALAGDPRLRHVRRMTQKTLRWPGFAARVATLAELGLLSEQPVVVGAARVSPRAVVDTVLAPHIRGRDDEPDLVVLTVEVRAGGGPTRCATLVDRFNAPAGLSAMSRTTGFTLAAAALRLITCPPIRGGCIAAHDLLDGETLFGELASLGVRVRWSNGR